MTLKDSPQLRAERANLQHDVRAEIERRGLTYDDLASRLGLLPVGAEILMSQSNWTLDVTYRVAEVVGMKLKMSVEPSD